MDQAKKNAQRDYDLNLLRKLMYGRGATLTERRRLDELYNDVSSDIVNHYVLTDTEREDLLKRLADPGVPQEKNLTEKLLEQVFEIRDHQERGFHGYHYHLETPRTSVSEWTLYLVSVLGAPSMSSSNPLMQFRGRMLTLAATAIAAAEWADRQLEEWRKKNPPRD